MRRTVRLAASLLVACAALSSYGQSAAKKNVRQDINVRMLANVATFDPFKSSDVADQKTHYQIFDSLLYETKEGTYQPAICTDYSFNKAGDVITFTIRKGVKFHNGSTVTPQDVAFSLNTAIASSFASKATSVMKSAEVKGDKVVLTLKYPFGPILGCLVSSSCSIVPKAVYEADPAGFAKNPVGSGPFTLGEIRRGETITLNAFPDYWRGAPAIKKIVNKIIPDNTAALMALESGEIDVMQPSQDYSDRQALLDNPKVTYYEAPQAVFFDIGFNCSKGVFTDKRLRQAVAYAIDKEDLILGAVNGMATPVEAAIVPMCSQYPKEFKAFGYDLAKAKALLAEAGYPKGLKLTMRIIGATNYTKPAEVIQAQLKKIGIELKIESMERATWFDKVYNGGEYEITYYAHSISVADADFCTYPFFHSSQADGKGSNFYNYKNPDLDKLLESARSITDETVRKKLYKQVAELVRDEAVCVPCYTGYRTYAAVKELKGVYADSMQRYYMYGYHW
jgi:peptide/nickel transport system substrate-binding protein